ncbi:hypothetical protein RINTHM_7920 [Richelia intracellularis HM01]|nr:hypothetical protein RINTHM_7920 [Richelia intracellularis HM01]
MAVTITHFISSRNSQKIDPNIATVSSLNRVKLIGIGGCQNFNL